MRRFIPLSLILCLLCGCSSFDPLHILPTPKPRPKPGPVVPVQTWEEQAPSKEIYKKIVDIFATARSTDADVTGLSLGYHGLFWGMALQIEKNQNLKTGLDVYTLLDASRANFGIKAGSIQPFSDYSAASITAAWQPTTASLDDPGMREKIANVFKSISCGCAAANLQTVKPKAEPVAQPSNFDLLVRPDHE
jgi:hypothetical protein